MAKNSEAPQTVALVLVEEVMSPNEDAELDVSDMEDLFDDLFEAIARQRAEVKSIIRASKKS